MPFTYLFGFLLAIATQAQAITPALPLPQCSSMIRELYQDRMPHIEVSHAIVRKKVECIAGFSKPSQVVHHEHVQLKYDLEDRQKIQKSMAQQGRQNPMVLKLCEQASYTFLLEFVDLSYRFYLDGDELGEVRVSAAMCNPT